MNIKDKKPLTDKSKLDPNSYHDHNKHIFEQNLIYDNIKGALANDEGSELYFLTSHYKPFNTKNSYHTLPEKVSYIAKHADEKRRIYRHFNFLLTDALLGSSEAKMARKNGKGISSWVFTEFAEEREGCFLHVHSLIFVGSEDVSKFDGLLMDKKRMQTIWTNANYSAGGGKSNSKKLLDIKIQREKDYRGKNISYDAMDDEDNDSGKKKRKRVKQKDPAGPHSLHRLVCYCAKSLTQAIRMNLDEADALHDFIGNRNLNKTYDKLLNKPHKESFGIWHIGSKLPTYYKGTFA